MTLEFISRGEFWLWFFGTGACFFGAGCVTGEIFTEAKFKQIIRRLKKAGRL